VHTGGSPRNPRVANTHIENADGGLTMSDLAVKHNGPGGQMMDAPADRSVTVTPRVDVLETEDGFLVLADMPGVKPDDVDVRFERGELTIHGRRPAARAGEPAH